MRALAFLFLTAAYFVVAVTSYSQVSAEDAAATAIAIACPAAPAGVDCTHTGSR